MRKFDLFVMLFYAVFLLFIFNYYDGKIEKLEKQNEIQNEKIVYLEEENKKLDIQNIKNEIIDLTQIEKDRLENQKKLNKIVDDISTILSELSKK